MKLLLIAVVAVADILHPKSTCAGQQEHFPVGGLVHEKGMEELGYDATDPIVFIRFPVVVHLLSIGIVDFFLLPR